MVIVIEGNLRIRSSDKVNTAFSGKIFHFLVFQIPLAYTAVQNHYLHMPRFIWWTLSLHIRSGKCIEVLEAQTATYPEETVLITARLWIKAIPVAPRSNAWV